MAHAEPGRRMHALIERPSIPAPKNLKIWMTRFTVQFRKGMKEFGAMPILKGILASGRDPYLWKMVKVADTWIAWEHPGISGEIAPDAYQWRWRSGTPNRQTDGGTGERGTEDVCARQRDQAQTIKF